MSTSFAQLAIGGADRRADAIRVELWRSVNAIGRWVAVLDNTGGTYNGVFDVQDQFLIDVNALANTLMQGRVDSSPAVMLNGVDAEDIFGMQIAISGVDQMQDFMFHNDLEQLYPDTAQDLDSILNDLINVGTITTNITYLAAVGTPVVGAVEFKEGTSFISTLQETFRSVDWLFYVDDVLALQSGLPGFSAMGAGSDVVCQAGNANNNVLGGVDFTERGGGKLYNRIRLYGKNPMFDAYTEQNVIPGAGVVVGWHPWQINFPGQMDNDPLALPGGTVRVGSYSVLAWNNNPVNQHIRLYYTLPYYNYTAFDFTAGEIGVWAYYDDTAGAPPVAGGPGAGTMGAGGGWPNPVALFCRLTDGTGWTADYFGRSTVLYRGVWGYCTFPLGEDGGPVAALIDEWFLSNPGFDWGDIRDIFFSVRPAGGFAAANYPSHVYLDGLSLPVPPIARAPAAAAEPTASQNAYRVRPLSLNMPNLRTQNALDAKATSLLAQHDSSGINWVKFTIIGNPLFRYAGQSFDIFIPDLGIDDGAGGPLVYYATSIHHVIEPRVDVSGGFGYDWITEVEAVPTGTLAYDHARLGPRAVFSSYQTGMNAGAGIRVK